MSFCQYCGGFGRHIWTGVGQCPGIGQEEKDDQIEQLKADFQRAKEWNQLLEIQIKNLQNIVEAQNDLLTRAADALADWCSALPEDLALDDRQLIAELRKATE
jgi:hypothetical protein